MRDDGLFRCKEIRVRSEVGWTGEENFWGIRNLSIDIKTQQTTRLHNPLDNHGPLERRGRSLSDGWHHIPQTWVVTGASA
jgi:hypothetical protein